MQQKTTSTWIRIWRTLALAGGALASGQAAGQVASDHSIALAPFLAARDMGEIDLGNALTVQAPKDRLWTSGVVGKIRPAFFSISAASRGLDPITRGLRVSYNPILKQPLAFASCGVDGACDALQVDGASSLSVSHEGMIWEVRASGSPCDGSYTCEFTLPAWSLEKRRQARLGPWRSFPLVATVLDHARGSTIFDAQSGAEWLTVSWKVSDGPSSGLGALTGATLSSEGNLSLMYEGGGLLLDFTTDRMFLATRDGVYLGDAGFSVGSGASGGPQWQELAFSEGEGRGKLLALSGDYVVWQDQLAEWSARMSPPSKIVGKFFAVPGHVTSAAIVEDPAGAVVDAEVEGGGQTNRWRYSRSTRRFGEMSDAAAGEAHDAVFVESTAINSSELKVSVLRQ